MSIRSPRGASNIGCAAACTASTLTCFAGELGLGELDQLGRAVADDRAVGGELRGEVVDIGLAHGRFGAEHADHAALRNLGRRLDRRHRADDRQVERRADVVERDGRGGVAGDHGEARPEALDEPAEQRRDAARQLRVALLAVGKAGAVGGIDDRRIGQQLARRPEHRQPADAGIEEEEGGFGVHHCVRSSVERGHARASRKLRARRSRFASSSRCCHDQ